MVEWNCSHSRITMNGKTYGRVEEMPADVRQQYERAMSMLPDRDGNGVPDVLEGKASPSDAGVTTVTRFVVNGREYTSLDELPDAVRAALNVGMHRGLGQGGGANPPRVVLNLSWSTLLTLIGAIGAAACLLAWFARR